MKAAGGGQLRSYESYHPPTPTFCLDFMTCAQQHNIFMFHVIYINMLKCPDRTLLWLYIVSASYKMTKVVFLIKIITLTPVLAAKKGVCFVVVLVKSSVKALFLLTRCLRNYSDLNPSCPVRLALKTHRPGIDTLSPIQASCMNSKAVSPFHCFCSPKYSQYVFLYY